MVPKDDLTLAILAGGLGARLGGLDKGTLKCEGRPLLERLRDLSVLAKDTLELRAADDVVKGRGAPGGLTSALCRAKTGWVLAVCCDMPHVKREAVEALCAADVHDIAAFDARGFVQPFPGLYRAGLGPSWRVLLEKGEPSMRELIASARVTRLALEAVDPTGRTVRSVNTAEDARALGVELP
jgi:molybdenum cofactor guanylyltransferase